MNKFELWTWYQDEFPKFYQSYETYEVAYQRGLEFSSKPIIYGTVILKVDGEQVGYFVSGSFFNKTDKVEPPKPLDRPDWDHYFLKIAKDVSIRSEDLFVKHGCVLVDRKTNNVISIGYNGLPAGADPSKIDLSNREERRDFMIHSEMNSILNAHKNPKELDLGAKAYVTGRCCNFCLQHLIQFGVNEIIELDQLGSITEDAKYLKQRRLILEMNPSTIVRQIKPNSKWLS